MGCWWKEKFPTISPVGNIRNCGGGGGCGGCSGGEIFGARRICGCTIGNCWKTVWKLLWGGTKDTGICIGGGIGDCTLIFLYLCWLICGPCGGKLFSISVFLGFGLVCVSNFFWCGFCRLDNPGDVVLVNFVTERKEKSRKRKLHDEAEKQMRKKQKL